MDIDNLTIGQAKEISNFLHTDKQDNCSEGTGPWEIGKKYFIRTVTMHLTGELIQVGDKELVLRNAAWIADSGRFNEALKDIDMCNEVEPFNNPAIIGRGSIIDATIISNIITAVK